MEPMIFLIILALVWIIFANVQDFKMREIADWLNISLGLFAIVFRFFYSLFTENPAFFYQGLIGLGIFFVIGNLFYYSKMFAGGDAKLMIAMGAILPFKQTFSQNIEIFGLFLFLFLFAGAIYTLIWCIFLVIKNFEKFKKDFNKRLKKNKKIPFLTLICVITLFLLGFINIIFLILGVFLFVSIFLYLTTKSIDKVCMIKNMDVKKLTLGDWLYKDIKIGEKIIKADWDGLTQKNINLLQKNFKKVKIRQGVPFAPAFLISFVILIIMWFTKLNIGILGF
jgi:Flp pilus assembly protein protease CpaA